MSLRRRDLGWLAFAVVLTLPVEVRGLQDPQRTAVDRTVSADEIRRLFRIPEVPTASATDRVDPTVTRPEVEALFKGLVEVVVVTIGTRVDTDGYRVELAAGDSLRTATVQINDTIIPFAPLDPGEYAVALGDLDGCAAPPAEPVTIRGGRITRAHFLVECPDLPTSLTVAVSGSSDGPTDVPTIAFDGGPPQELGGDSPAVFSGLEPGPNRLVLSLPETSRVPGTFDLNVAAAPTELLPPGAFSVRLGDGDPRPISPVGPVTFSGSGGEPIIVNLIPRQGVAPSTSVIVDLEGAGAGRLVPGSTTIRIRDGDPQEIGPGVSARFDSLATDSIRLVLTLSDSILKALAETADQQRDRWHFGAGLGAIAVSATDPTSFVTPTVSLALARRHPGAEPGAEWLYLNAQVGYWRAGPSATDPVLPDDPRPPFRNRTIWTWSVGASYFGSDWGGLGVSAAWVEGRETASREDKYMNRSRGIAIGPRYRVLTDAPWPSVLLGLDVQYGEAEELLRDDPELRWSLTPTLSFSYVLR